MKSKIPRNSHHIVLLLCIVFICSLITIHFLVTNKEGFVGRDCVNLVKKIAAKDKPYVCDKNKYSTWHSVL